MNIYLQLEVRINVELCEFLGVHAGGEEGQGSEVDLNLHHLQMSLL